MATATQQPVRLPPGPRLPKSVQGIAFLMAKHDFFAFLGRRYGTTLTVDMPLFGRTVVIRDPLLIKELVARIRAILRRASHRSGRGNVPDQLVVGPITLNTGTRLVHVANKPVSLTGAPPSGSRIASE